MLDLAPFVGGHGSWARSGARKDVSRPGIWVAGAIGPSLERRPERRMAIVRRIGERLHPLGRPQGPADTGWPGLERVQPALSRPIQRLEQILDWRVVGGVAYEHQLELLHQAADEGRRPAVGQIGPAEVGARQDELFTGGRCLEAVAQAAVEIDHAVPLLRPVRPRQQGRNMAIDGRIMLFEQTVEVGRHQTDGAVGPAR
ncbi:hypothetical protein D3C72_889390 [compost metagenome]